MDNTTTQVQNIPEHPHSLFDVIPTLHLIHILIGVGIAAAILIPLLFWRYRRKLRQSTASSIGNLETEKARSSLILNSIEDSVVVIDTQNTIQLCNPAAATLVGWKLADCIGIDFHSVFTFTDATGKPLDPSNDPVGKTLKTAANVRDNNIKLIAKTKQHMFISISVSPILGPDKQLDGVVAVFRDISKEKTEEQQRAEFISTASHEMRTPVAAIEGYLALALNERVSKIDSKAREYLEKAHFSTQHLGKLFQDLLTSAKAEDGRLSSHPVAIEMGEFLEKLTDDLKFTAEKKGLHMEFVIGAANTQQVIDASGEGSSRIIRPLYYVYADPDRVREVITNLFDNAVKYTESGKVSLGITGNDQVVQLYVKDTGPGIPADDIPHLFQKFYRVDNSATRTVGGTGLGLFISRKIVELYSGRIWVESEVGKGSSFFINLPRMSGDKAEELTKSQQATQVADTSIAGTS